MIVISVKNSLDELVSLLKQLSKKDYSNPFVELSDASIGEHTRHIIEMFQCLEREYDSGIVNYDNRERSQLIQTDPEYAILQIQRIQQGLQKENKILQLHQFVAGEVVDIQTNYYRELLYNLEHCIHHQALIKVAVLKLDHVIVDGNFGVAPSTVEFRKKCVQ